MRFAEDSLNYRCDGRPVRISSIQRTTIMIYHITLPEEWEKAVEQGYHTAASIATEGFIHCSEAVQVERSLNRFFAGRPRVLLLTIDPERLTSELRYEPAHGELFPHIYGPLSLDAVVDVSAIEPADGRFHFSV